MLIFCGCSLNGCSLTPLVIDNGDMYLGAFIGNKEEGKDCQYSEVEGAGLKVGLAHFNFGVGYFERKTLVVKTRENVYCSSVIADVYVGELVEEKAQNINAGP